jgi:Domain of unknown function (DUF1127)
MWKRLQTWWKATGDLVQLRGLDDRLLADMGLAREDLAARVLAQDEQGSARIVMSCACRPAAGLLRG